MKIAFITDIHEDFKALTNAVKLLKQAGYDLLVCLGDITGYAPVFYNHAPDANACIDLLKEEADIVLAGNHDLFTCKRLSDYQRQKGIGSNWYDLTSKEQSNFSKDAFWLYQDEVLPSLSISNMQFLLSLKEWCTLETGNNSLLFSHFVKPDLSGTGTWLPHRIPQLRPHFRFMKELKCSFSFTGHFHPDNLMVAGRLFWSKPGITPFRIKRNPGIVLCPALVSKANSGSCIIYDSTTNEIISYILG